MREKKNKKEVELDLEYEVNIENEQVIIASFIKSKLLRKRIIRNIVSMDFIGKRHRIIFKALVKMEHQKLEYNEDTLIQFAGEDNIGGYSYLQEILDNFDVNANIKYHIEQLKTDKLKFEIYNGPFKNLAEIIFSKKAEHKEILRASTNLSDLIQGRIEAEKIMSGERLSKDYVKDFNERFDRDFIGTGLVELDNILTEGFVPGTISVIAGRPQMGKTMFMMNAIVHLVRTKKLLICEIEMGNITFLDMLIALYTGIDLSLIVKEPEKLVEKDQKRIKHKVQSILSNSNFSFLDDPELSLDRLELELRNRKYDVCFIDLFGRLIDVTSEPSQMTRKLHQAKRIARKTNTHLCLIHQMRRQKDEKKKVSRPTLERLKDSGSWEEVGDLIIALHREKYYNPQLKKDVAEVWVLKQKRGESNLIVPFEFTGKICEFGEHIKDYVAGRDMSGF